jgi:hypothetical protein
MHRDLAAEFIWEFHTDVNWRRRDGGPAVALKRSELGEVWSRGHEFAYSFESLRRYYERLIEPVAQPAALQE